MLMNDGDIHTEYPADIDDENVSEKGFQSILPGEPTRLSSALTLFRAARIMSKVLNEVYLANPSSELSLQKISALNDELEAWLQSLTPYHRLQFIQEKPSTNLTGSRSPLLVIMLCYLPVIMLILVKVSCISLHSHIDSPSGVGIKRLRNGLIIDYGYRELQQTHHTDCAAARGASHELLVLPKQGRTPAALRVRSAVPSSGIAT